MYFCPNGHTDHEPAFYAEQLLARKQYIDETGEDFSRSAPIVKETGAVRCTTCDALAEYRDARQMEMFEVEAPLFD